MKKTWIWVGVVVIIAAIAGGFWWQQSQQNAPVTDKVAIGNPATIYLHGFGGGPGSTNTLIKNAEKDGAQKVLTATVAPSGKVTWTGDPQKVKHPIIQVLFTNNRNPDYTVDGTWVRNVMRGLKRQYGVTEVNIVAHSMGNMAAMFYATRYGNDKDVPTLKAYVAIAGHYDGILGRDDQPNRIKLNAQGYPTPVNETYADLVRLRDKFPKNVRVLNLYGNLEDGSNSDGRVANNSSRSLKYLVAPSQASYREQMFKGKDAQHSALHQNPAVAKAVDDFLDF